ncbi:MAG: RNA-guided endonuclease TnpB family protein [Methanomassiliicoccales archaeon]|jgi:putative transposase
MKVFEYRLRPNKNQEAALMKVLTVSRLMYNAALEEWKRHLNETGKYLGMYKQDKQYNKQTYPDLPAVVVDQVMKRLHRALTLFFLFRREGKTCGFPRFKGVNQWNSIEYRDQGNYLKGRYFQAGKLCGGKIRTVVHRPLEGEFRFARIIKRPSGWYLQCVCLVENKPLPATGNAVGIDVGIKSVVADSNGGIVPNPQFLKAEIKNLAHSQRLLSRKTKGSKHYKKQAQVVARRHERIHSRRKDFLHKLARRYICDNDVIVVENLNVSGMIKNHHLARAISDVSWSMFRDLLASKAENAGRLLISVSPRFTSQKCSKCGEYVEKSLSVRTHACPYCGYIDDRDVNAAKNILKIGLDEAIEEGFQWATR